MLINNKKITGLLLSLLILLFGTACSITPEAKLVQAPETQTNSPEYVPITALELAQLKDAALQWQQARAGIERILKLEKEITYLVNHIDIINSKAIAQSNKPTNSSYSTRTIHNQQAARSRSQSVNQYRNKKQTVKLNTPRHIFALQVASVDSEKDIAKAWKELNTKAAPLFRKKILTNVETAKINKKTFYRLKLGSYQNLKNAKADCEVFKVYKLDCIVSNYTDKPVKL